MKHSFSRDFFTTNRSADFLISLCSIVAFSVGNYFFMTNFFGHFAFINAFLVLLGGVMAFVFHYVFLQIHYGVLLSKGLTNHIFKKAFLRFSIILISFASLSKGILYFVFSSYVAFSAMVVPVLYAFLIVGALLANIVILVRSGFVRVQSSQEGFVYLFLPFLLLAIFKIVFLGVL